MSCHPLDFRIACVSSQPRPGAGITGSHYSVRNTIGRRAVPTFFWGEATSPGRLQGIADRLILMGDWRDVDRSQINEETDAVVELDGVHYFEYPYRISSEKFVRTFDSGQLMGDPL